MSDGKQHNVGEYINDALVYGKGFMLAGKHIPYDQVVETWVPQVGQECEYRPSKSAAWARVKVVAIHRGYSWLDYVDSEGSEPYTVGLGEFRPTPSEADKQREEQIETMQKIAAYAQGFPRNAMGRKLYDSGCRIIAPDEYVVKALTDEQVRNLDGAIQKYLACDGSFSGIATIAAKIIERELGIRND